MATAFMWLAALVALVVVVCAQERETGILWNIFDGSVYEGEYKRGYVFSSRDGKGALRWYRTGDGYEGDFADNMKHGDYLAPILTQSLVNFTHSSINKLTYLPSYSLTNFLDHLLYQDMAKRHIIVSRRKRKMALPTFAIATMMASILKIKSMAKVRCCTATGQRIQGGGSLVYGTEKEFYDILMESLIAAILSKGRKKAKDL